MATMADMTFGVELETFGAGKVRLLNALAGQDGWHGGAHHGVAIDPKGRRWAAKGDQSINGANPAEIVTPVLKYEDMAMLQAAIRVMRAAGAKVNDSCGVHIHVGADQFDAPAVVRLVKYWHRKEALIKHALGTLIRRTNTYCRDINAGGFIDRLDARRGRVRTMQQLHEVWYGGEAEARVARGYHYHGSRYHALNLHALQYHGTIEFRLFNATLHAGKVRAYVQFVLLVALHALNTRTAARPNRAPFDATTAKYDFRVCILRLGGIGDEFKTMRKHLTKHLQGNAARKRGRRPAQNPAPAAAVAGPAGAPAHRETDEERLARETRELAEAGWYFTADRLWVGPNGEGGYTRELALQGAGIRRRAA